MPSNQLFVWFELCENLHATATQRDIGRVLFETKSIGKLLFRVATLILVAVGIVYSIRGSADELERQRADLELAAENLRIEAEEESDASAKLALLENAADLESQARDFWKPAPFGLLKAAVFYALGMLPACLFWRRCLLALGQAGHNLFDVMWAYFYGNLGKYFPGKAMVLVLRIAALERSGIKKTATSMTIFMETLTMMSVGGAIGAVCLIILRSELWLTAVAICIVVATFLPASPPVLKFLLPRLQKGVEPEQLREWTDRITWSLFLRGWLMLTVTWVLFGLSLLFVLQSLPSTSFASATQSDIYVSAVGACALAVVLGFVSLIPGGAGVREVVLSTVLAPIVGPVAALCAALWLRIVWLCTELVVVGILGFIRFTQIERPAAR